MFKLLIAVTTTLSMMFGVAATVSTRESRAREAQIAANAGESIQSQEQTQIRDGSETQDQLQLQNQIREQAQILEQDQLQIQEQTQLQTQDLLQDQTRDQLQEQDRIHQTDTIDPLHLNSNNPWTTEPPVPNSGYGPGTGTCDTCASAPETGQNGSGNGNKP